MTSSPFDFLSALPIFSFFLLVSEITCSHDMRPSGFGVASAADTQSECARRGIECSGRGGECVFSKHPGIRRVIFGQCAHGSDQ